MLIQPPIPADEAESEDSDRPAQVLQPSNEDQRVAIAALDAVDQVMPEVMKAWRAERPQHRGPASQWLFERIRACFLERPDFFPQGLSDSMLAHRVCIA